MVEQTNLVVKFERSWTKLTLYKAGTKPNRIKKVSKGQNEHKFLNIKYPFNFSIPSI